MKPFYKVSLTPTLLKHQAKENSTFIFEYNFDTYSGKLCIKLHSSEVLLIKHVIFIFIWLNLFP